MFYVNKKNKNDICELIHSGPGFSIIVNKDTSEGKILKYGKKEFKKHYKKIKSNKYIPVNEELKEHIIETFNTDKTGILDYTEEYIERSQYLERQEEFKNMTEEERKLMLEELAD